MTTNTLKITEVNLNHCIDVLHCVLSMPYPPRSANVQKLQVQRIGAEMVARIWALVIDPMHARVLRGFNSADGEEPIEFVSHAASARLRAIMSSAVLGARDDSHDPEEPPTSAEAANELRQDTADFLRETLSFLEMQHRAHRFERLAVFADPAMLSSVQTQLSAQLQDGLILHAARRLMTLPQEALHRRLRAVIDQSDKQSGEEPRNQGSD